MSRRGAALLASAVAGAFLVPVGLWASATPAVAASSGTLSAKVTFSCKIATFPAYQWVPTLTVSMLRPEGSSTVTVTGKLTEMSGASPVKLNYDLTTSLVLDVAGTAVTGNGSSHVVTTAAYQAFPLPDTTATFSSLDSDLAVKVTSFSFAMDPTGLNMKGVCTPTAGAALGTMTPSDGVPPTPTIVPTTISSATATPSVSSSASATASADASGTPAKGKVTFACVLNQTSSKFSYPATISVSGYRTSSGGDLNLVATMSDIPGIAPVVVDGTMDITLGVTVGGTKATLTGSTHAKAQPYQVVPVPTLSGTVAVSGDDLKVVAKTFRFAFPDMSIDADCTSSAPLTKAMKVGTKASATATSGGSGSSSGSGTSTSTLPKTGASNLGLMLAWGVGLVAIGSSGLVLIRRFR
jgi:LPXTG-motif cell wall-anchored protein